jgi:uncharacterized protein
VDYDERRQFSLVNMVDIKLLEEELGVRVDMTTRDSLHPLLRSDIENLAVRVF